MKTNPFLLLTTVLLCGGTSLHADDNLCGGADDDQIFGAPSICGGADDDQIFGAPSICGGADDDQYVPPLPLGPVSNTLGIVVVPNPAPQPGIVPNPAQPPVLQGFTTDPLGIPPPPRPPVVPDPMAMWAALTGPVVPAEICGGNGNDSLKPMPLTDTMILHLLGGGSFTGTIVGGDGADFLFGSAGLWGGGGTDEINAGDPDF